MSIWIPWVSIYLKIVSFPTNAHLRGTIISKINGILITGGRKGPLFFSFNFLQKLFLLICLLKLSHKVFAFFESQWVKNVGFLKENYHASPCLHVLPVYVVSEHPNNCQDYSFLKSCFMCNNNMFQIKRGSKTSDVINLPFLVTLKHFT